MTDQAQTTDPGVHLPPNFPQQLPFPVTPSMYFNGFGVIGGATDLTVILHNGNFQVASIQAAIPVMKELVEAIQRGISEIETSTGITQPKLSELIQMLQAAQRVKDV